MTCRLPVLALRRTVARSLLVFGLAAAALAPVSASAQEAPPTPDAGYVVPDDGVLAFYTNHGGAATFGQPISREFNLFGTPTQLFDNAALEVLPDGSVAAMPLAGSGLLPYTEFAGQTVPAATAALVMVAPTPDQPAYAQRVQVFLQASVPDSWNGQPVQFLSTLNATGGLDVWGMPTSAPAADPNNPQFIYQRFANGIMFYDASAGSTVALPLGQYLKDVLTAQSQPADLASEAATASLWGQLAGSDAFTPDAA